MKATIPLAPKDGAIGGPHDRFGHGQPVRNVHAEQAGPPQVRSPKLVQGVEMTVSRRNAMRKWIKRHGRVFEFNVPFFGRSVAVSDPALVRSVFTASTEQLTNYQPNLSNFSAPGQYSRSTAVSTTIAVGFSGRPFTVGASGITSRSSLTRYCAKPRIGWRTKSFAFSNR